MLKRISLIISICMVTIIFAGCSIVDNTIVATVNNEKILKSEFLYNLEGAKSQVYQLAGSSMQQDDFFMNGVYKDKPAAVAARDAALTMCVDNLLAYIEAKKQGIVLTQKEKLDVGKQKAAVMQQLGGQNGYNEFLKSYGFTDESFRAFIERTVTANKLGQKIDEETPAPTDDEIKAFFEANYVRAKHILISKRNEDGSEKDQAGKDAALAKAKEVLEKVKAGGDFDKLMEEFGEDPGAKSDPDGYIFSEGEMVKPFEDAAKALAVGVYSDIVETDFGYHIIKREDAMAKYQDFIDKKSGEGETATTGKDALIAKIKTENNKKLIETWKNSATIVPNQKVIDKISVVSVEKKK